MSKAERLSGIGFVLAGSWVLDATGRIRLGDLEGRPCSRGFRMPDGPGVYLFTADSAIGYIGETGGPFRARMRAYDGWFGKAKRPRNYFYTDVETALRAGREVLIYTHTMPDASKADREQREYELISRMKPLWNGGKFARIRTGA